MTNNKYTTYGPGDYSLTVENGNIIKEIGIRARKDIEKYFNKKVYLELFVKVIPKWRDKEKFLNMIGYKDFLNK